LQKLVLTDVPEITDEGIMIVAKAKHLEVLQIGSSRKGCEYNGTITDLSLIALGSYAHSLRKLCLENCREVSDQGVGALVHGCPRLRSLALCFCAGLSDSAAIHALEGCSSLKMLHIKDCQAVCGEFVEAGSHIRPSCTCKYETTHETQYQPGNTGEDLPSHFGTNGPKDFDIWRALS